MSADYLITVDATAAARAAALLPVYQAKEPSADLAYIYRAAARVGSRQIGVRPASDRVGQQYGYSAADFALLAGGTAEVSITVDDEDAARIEGVADLLSVPAEHVAGAAACTGLALLSGIWARIAGPFTM